MIDLVFWSFAMPLATLIPLSLGARSLARLAPHLGVAGRPGSAPIAHLPIRAGGEAVGADLAPDFVEITCGFSPGPVVDEPSYRDAVAILDRLFVLDRRQTPAELRYFQELAERVYQYERRMHLVGGRGGFA